MAAPRKYGDAARAAIWALHEQGVSSAEIARRCQRGMAGVAPFRVPRRTVADIVWRMAQERGQADSPRKFEDLVNGDGEELVAKYPKRVLTLLEADSQRLERKSERGQALTLDDYNRLRCGVGIVGTVRKLQSPRLAPVRNRGRRRATSAPETGSLADYIGREHGQPESAGKAEPTSTGSDEKPSSLASEHAQPTTDTRKLATAR